MHCYTSRSAWREGLRIQTEGDEVNEASRVVVRVLDAIREIEASEEVVRVGVGVLLMDLDSVVVRDTVHVALVVLDVVFEKLLDFDAVVVEEYERVGVTSQFSVTASCAITSAIF